MSVDLRKIKKLIELVEESGISELEVSDGDESIRIARPLLPAGIAASAPAAGPAVVVSNPVASQPGRGTSFEIRSPMPGTFYRAPAPDAGPFVAVGQAVQAGDVLCIIESMKMMNEVSAERAGVCVAAEVENGEAISSGQVLFRFE
jgi:acetyl-CoA carboxylase biotin carboxyl carrier protein